MMGTTFGVFLCFTQDLKRIVLLFCPYDNRTHPGTIACVCVAPCCIESLSDVAKNHSVPRSVRSVSTVPELYPDT